MPSVDRRLQAIMFTDVSGYSAMMGADEAATIAMVREHRDLVRGVLARHAGLEQRTVGDAFLVLFDSAVHAVACAIEIQELFLARNAGAAAGRQLWLRIGIHAGEVVHEDDGEIAGDAVNIAARIEGLAPPGGICLSEMVAAQVRGKLSRPLEPMPPVALKNIAAPPSLFRIAIAPAPRMARPIPRWARPAALVFAASAAVALAAWGLRPAPGPWPIASDDPAAQAKFDEAMVAFARADSRVTRLAREAAAADPSSPYALLLVALVTPPGEAALTRERVVALVEGRDDPQARLIRLWDAGRREQAGGVSNHVGSELVHGWDAWEAENPSDVLGQFVRAQEYPLHGAEENFHALDPNRRHLNNVEAREFLAQHPDWPAARLLVMRTHPPSDDGETPALLEEGIARCPDCAALEAELGAWLASHRRDAEARTHLQRAIAIDSGVTGAREALALLALREGDEASRVRLVEGLLGPEEPAERRGWFAWTHTQALLDEGRFREALELYERAAAAFQEAHDYGSEPDTLVQLGLTLAGLHEADRADAVCDRLVQRIANPSVGEDTRAVAGLKVIEIRGLAAFARRDVGGVMHTVEELRKLQSGRTPPGTLTGALDGAESNLELLQGRRARFDAAPQIESCGWWVERAGGAALLGDRTLARQLLDRALAPDTCVASSAAQFIAHLVAAQIATDTGERAEHVSRARALWPHADPDGRLMRELDALSRSP